MEDSMPTTTNKAILEVAIERLRAGGNAGDVGRKVAGGGNVVRGGDLINGCVADWSPSRGGCDVGGAKGGVSRGLPRPTNVPSSGSADSGGVALDAAVDEFTTGGGGTFGGDFGGWLGESPLSRPLQQHSFPKHGKDPLAFSLSIFIGCWLQESPPSLPNAETSDC